MLDTKRAGLLLLVLVAAACSSKKKSEESIAPEQAPAAAPESATANSAAKPEPPPPAQPIASLPAYSEATPSDEAAQKSRELNVAGLALHREKKFAEAEPLFLQALEANPGNILARYNLACTYNLGGKREAALAALAGLRRQDCRACAAQVLGAPADKDWQSALADPKFVELTTGLEIASPTKRELAELVFKAFDTDKVGLIADLIHPSRATKFRYAYGLCDPSEDTCHSTSKVYGLQAFTKAMKELVNTSQEDGESMVSFGVGEGVGTCGPKCCDYTIGSVTHGTLWLSEVCYTDKAGVLLISQITTTDEN